MKGLPGEEEDLEYVDQVEVIARFCEEQSPKRPVRKRVAWLDDRTNVDTNTTSIRKGDCRPYLGPLTAQKLWRELGKKASQVGASFRAMGRLTRIAQRFRTSSEQAAPDDGAFEHMDSDAERRVM
jgi:L-fucose isomerase-like protein